MLVSVVVFAAVWAAGDVVTLFLGVFVITKNGGDGNRGGIGLR